MVMLDSACEPDSKISATSKVEESTANDMQSVPPVANPAYTVAMKPCSTARNSPDDHGHQMSYSVLLQQPDVLVSVLGEAIHNLNDGIAIATAFTLSWETGINER